MNNDSQGSRKARARFCVSLAEQPWGSGPSGEGTAWERRTTAAEGVSEGGSVRCQRTHYPYPHTFSQTEGVADDASHYDVAILTLSDNYITEVLMTFHETHLPYMLQWSEQNIVLDTAAGDQQPRQTLRAHAV